MNESILSYARFRWLGLAGLLCLAAAIVYSLHGDIEPANGGSWKGYVLGSVAACLIVWLTWFGIRKRQYASTNGTMKGWLSAHVYLGLALLWVATLHTGFQFGANIHTLAYVLMVLVIASGLIGVGLYLRYPQLISANRQEFTRLQMLQEIEALDQLSQNIAVSVGLDVAGWVDEAIKGTRIGGGVVSQISGRDRSVLGDHRNSRQQHLSYLLADRLANASDPGIVGKLQELMQVVSNKRNWVRRVQRDISLQSRLEIWRYLHVPLTTALLAALLAHIVSVFWYW